jgi:hypothetical protein
MMATIEVHGDNYSWSAVDILNSTVLCCDMARRETKHLRAILEGAFTKKENVPMIDGNVTSKTVANAIADDLKYSLKNRAFKDDSLSKTACTILTQLNSVYRKNIGPERFGCKLVIAGQYAETQYCGLPVFYIRMSSRYMCNELLKSKANETFSDFKKHGIWNADRDMAMISQLPACCKQSRGKIIQQLRLKPRNEEDVEKARQCLEYLWLGLVTLPELVAP